MSDLYFFAEVDKLENQNNIASPPTYGPDPANNQLLRYRVSTGFSLKPNETECWTYAPFDCQIIAVQSWNNPDLVNLILQPTKLSQSLLKPDILFFVIRNLRLSDIVQYVGNQPQLVNSGAPSQLVAALYEYNQRITPPLNQSQLLERIGYVDDPTTIQLDIIQDMFSRATLMPVDAGTALARYSTSVAGGNPLNIDCFIDDRKHIPMGSYASSTEYAIEVTSSATYPHLENYQTRAIREQILNFIDPCAWYSIHAEAGIRYYPTNTATTSTKISGFQDVYSNIINLFATRNYIYLDLRNENDTSLDYYNDNLEGNNNFKVDIFSTGSLIPQQYHNYNWPIYVIDASILTTSRTDWEFIDVAFYKKYNPRPIFYLDFAIGWMANSPMKAHDDYYFAFDSGAFLEDTSPVPSSSTPDPTSDEVKLATPLWQITSTTNSRPVCWYIRLHVVRTELPDPILTSLPTTVVKNESYLDSVFGPVFPMPSAAPAYPVYLSQAGRVSISGPFAKRFITHGPGQSILAVQNSIANSTEYVCFFTHEINSSLSFPHTYFLAGSSNDSGNKPNILQIDSSYNSLLQFINQVFSLNLKRLSSPGVTWFDQSHIPEDVSPAPLRLLIMTRQELNDIRSLLYNASTPPASPMVDVSLHNIHFSFDDFDKGGINNRYYNQFTLRLHGMDVNGDYIKIQQLDLQTVPGVATPLEVFSTDGLTYSTGRAGADGIVIPELTTDPNAYVQFEDMINDVKTVEDVYLAKAETGDTYRDIVTRLRVHYYGESANSAYFNRSFFDRIKRGIAFNDAIGCADLYNLDGSSKGLSRSDIPEAYARLTSDADENAIQDNPSPYLIDPDGKYVDWGHMIYGLDGLFCYKSIYPDANNPQELTGVSGYEGHKLRSWFFQADYFGILENNDLTGYIADVFPPAAESRVYSNDVAAADKMRENSPYYPLLNDIAALYDISAPEADILSDMDAHCLWQTWRLMEQDVIAGEPLPHRSLDDYSKYKTKFSQVLEFYYDSTRLLVNTGEPVITKNNANYRLRFKMFCAHPLQGFLGYSGGTWVWTMGNPANLPYVRLRMRAEAFCAFWYSFNTMDRGNFKTENKIRKNTPKSSPQKPVRFENSSNLNTNIQSRVGQFIGTDTDDTELLYCLNRFLNFLNQGIQNERTNPSHPY